MVIVAHPSVKKLIEISRLDSILSIIPTVEESVEFIFMEEMEREILKTMNNSGIIKKIIKVRVHL